MRSVSSAFWAALQGDTVNLCELIELSTRTKTWRWTTSNQEIVSSGQVYAPFPGNAGGGIEESIDLGISVVDFVFANSGGEFNGILDSYAADWADLTIRRVFVDSPGLGNLECFRGKLGDYSTDHRHNIAGQARNIFNSVNIQWPYYTYMDQCAWRFGGVGCGFDTSSITIVGTVEASSGFINVTVVGSAFTSSGYADGHFDKGRFTFTSGLNSGQTRSVRVHSGDQLALSHRLPYAIAGGDTFSLFPGCRKRLVGDCVSRYNNSSNFLGFPWIPRQEQAF